MESISTYYMNLQYSPYVLRPSAARSKHWISVLFPKSVCFSRRRHSHRVKCRHVCTYPTVRACCRQITTQSYQNACAAPLLSCMHSTTCFVCARRAVSNIVSCVGPRAISHMKSHPLSQRRSRQVCDLFGCCLTINTFYRIPVECIAAVGYCLCSSVSCFTSELSIHLFLCVAIPSIW